MKSNNMLILPAVIVRHQSAWCDAVGGFGHVRILPRLILRLMVVKHITPAYRISLPSECSISQCHEARTG
jgi:hypothetical protein